MTDSGVGRAPSSIDWREVVAVLLLSVTAVATAWTGFEASKWSGAMSISFSQASGDRIKAGRLDGVTNRKLSLQVSLFTSWLQAHQAGDDKLAAFLEDRFPEPLATAFPSWLRQQPLKNPEAPASPFDMATYVIPEVEAAEQADASADRRFASALEYNQRGDNYTVLTIGFAIVLFFGALAGRMRGAITQWALLGLGWVGFLVLAATLTTFPKLV